MQPVAQTCYRWEGSSSMPPGFPVPSTASLVDGADGGAAGTPGSLGATSMIGNFSAEVTEVGKAPPGSGFSQERRALSFYWGHPADSVREDIDHRQQLERRRRALARAARDRPDTHARSS